MNGMGMGGGMGKSGGMGKIGAGSANPAKKKSFFGNDTGGHDGSMTMDEKTMDKVCAGEDMKADEMMKGMKKGE